jgi:hypothetical protein
MTREKQIEQIIRDGYGYIDTITVKRLLILFDVMHMLPTDKEINQVACDEMQRDYYSLKEKEVYKKGYIEGATWCVKKFKDNVDDATWYARRFKGNIV